MKRFFRGLFYGLIFVLIGLASALTAMRFAIHGREVTVPNVVGFTPADAQKLAADKGLQYLNEQRFYSSEVPQGRVVSQLPAAGTRVRVGYRLRVAESLGAQRAEVPSLIGQSQRSAELNLRRQGLELGTVAQLPTADSAPELVVAQSPSPGAQRVSTPDVSVLMAAPPNPEQFVMPDFVGSSLSEASTAVRAAGLTVATVASASAASAEQGTGQRAKAQRPVEGVITRQTPAPGQRITAGATVSFEVTPR